MLVANARLIIIITKKNPIWGLNTSHAMVEVPVRKKKWSDFFGNKPLLAWRQIGMTTSIMSGSME